MPATSATGNSNAGVAATKRARQPACKTVPAAAAEDAQKLTKEFRDNIIDVVLRRRRAAAAVQAPDTSQLPANSLCNQAVLDLEACRGPDVCQNMQSWLKRSLAELALSQATALWANCADELVRVGEITCARDKLYCKVIATCQRAAEQAGGAQRISAEMLSLWVRSVYACGDISLQLTLAADPYAKTPATQARCMQHLQEVVAGMQLVLDLPQRQREEASWLLLNGITLLSARAAPLATLSPDAAAAAAIAPLFVYAAVAMEACVRLSTARHLQRRVRLYATACHCYEDAGELEAARACLARCAARVAQLRREEEMDPPLPRRVAATLAAAERDVAVLSFKFEALAAAAAAPLTPAAVAALLSARVGAGAQERAAALAELLCAARGVGAAGGGAARERWASAAAEALLLEVAPPGQAAQEAHGEEGALPLPLDSRTAALLLRQLYFHDQRAAAARLLPRVLVTLDQDPDISSIDHADRRAELELLGCVAQLPTWLAPPAAAGAAAAAAEAPAQAAGKARKASSSGAKPKQSPTSKLADATEGVAVAATAAAAAAMPAAAAAKTGGGAAAAAAAMASSASLESLREGVIVAKRNSGDFTAALAPDGGGGGGGLEAAAPLQLWLGEARGGRVTADLSAAARAVDALRTATERIHVRGAAAHVARAAAALYAQCCVPLLIAAGGEPDAAAAAAAAAQQQQQQQEGGAAVAAAVDPRVKRQLAVLALLLSALSAVHAALRAADADDAALRAAVVLRLGLLLSDGTAAAAAAQPTNCQPGAARVLREGLSDVRGARARLVDPLLYPPQGAALLGAVAALSASAQPRPLPVSTEPDASSDTAAWQQLTDRSNLTQQLAALQVDLLSTLFRVELEAGSLKQQLAALQVDLLSTLFRVDLEAGRGAARAAESKRRRDKAAAAARFAALARPPKMAQRTSGVPSASAAATAAAAAAPSHGAAAAAAGGSAATAGHAAVIGAGAEPLLPPPQQQVPANGDGGDEQLPLWCAATEARLAAEAGAHDGAARAVLAMQAARFRSGGSGGSSGGGDAEALLRRAMAQLVAAEERELAQLAAQCPPSLTFPGDDAPAAAAAATAPAAAVAPGTPVPAPVVVSRSHAWVVVQPRPFVLRHAARPAAAAAVSALNALAASGGSREAAAPASIAYVQIYAKPAGAGTAVSLHSDVLPGSGVPVAYDATTGRCAAAMIRGLQPGEAYVFAVAAFDADGNEVGMLYTVVNGSEEMRVLQAYDVYVKYVVAVAAFDADGNEVGGGIGTTSPPVEALLPLPLSLLWSHVARIALAQRLPQVAATAARAALRRLAASPPPLPPLPSPPDASAPTGVTAHAAWPGVAAVPPVVLLPPPLPSLAHIQRLPRALQQAFVQTCATLAAAERELSDDAQPAAAAAAAAAAVHTARRAALAALAAAGMRDWPLTLAVVRDCHEALAAAARALAPAPARLLLEAALMAHAAVAEVPRGLWCAAAARSFAFFAHQVTTMALDLGELAAAKEALFGTPPPPNAPLGVPPERAATEQLRLLEAWLSNPDVSAGISTEQLRVAAGIAPRAAGAAASAAASGGAAAATAPAAAAPAEKQAKGAKKRASVAADARAAAAPPAAAAAEATPAPEVELIEAVAGLAPADGWAVLQLQFPKHPKFPAAAARVWRAALQAGETEQVIAWGAAAAATSSAAAAAAGAATATPLYSVDALCPAALQLLLAESCAATQEELPAVFPYIGAAAASAANAAAAPSSDAAAAAAAAGPTAPLQAADETAAAAAAVAAATEQLVVLAEVEAVLGEAHLRLAAKQRAVAAAAAAAAAAPAAPAPALDACGPYCELPPALLLLGAPAAAAAAAPPPPPGAACCAAGDEGQERWPTPAELELCPSSSVEVDTLSPGAPHTMWAAAWEASLAAGVASLARAAGRARAAKAWAFVSDACAKLWDEAVVPLWLSPRCIGRSDGGGGSDGDGDGGSGGGSGGSGGGGGSGSAGCAVLTSAHARVFAIAAEALMEGVAALTGGDNEGREGEWPGGEGDAVCSSGQAQGVGTRAADVAVCRHFVEGFVLWCLRALLRCGHADRAARLGRRLQGLPRACAAAARALLRGHAVLLTAQERLCEGAAAALHAAEGALTAADAAYEAAQGAAAALHTAEGALAAADTAYEAAQAVRPERNVRPGSAAQAQERARRLKEEREHLAARRPLEAAAGDALARRQVEDHRRLELLECRAALLEQTPPPQRLLDEACAAAYEYVSLRDGGICGLRAYEYIALWDGGMCGAPAVNLRAAETRALATLNRIAAALRKDRADRRYLARVLSIAAEL
ncbi:hypothetical protein JKP88DRAFT_287868, partial [Tribonema minus]